MVKGTFIGDGLRTGAELRPAGWRITRIYRLDQSAITSPDQPKVWTVVDFEAEDEDADAVAGALAQALEREGGWYADFRVGDEHVVVFADKVFRYPRGDRAARAEVARYGESTNASHLFRVQAAQPNPLEAEPRRPSGLDRPYECAVFAVMR